MTYFVFPIVVCFCSGKVAGSFELDGFFSSATLFKAFSDGFFSNDFGSGESRITTFSPSETDVSLLPIKGASPGLFVLVGVETACASPEATAGSAASKRVMLNLWTGPNKDKNEH